MDTLEHEFLSSGDDSMLLLMRLAQFLTCGLILVTNVPMIIFTTNQGSKTFLDWLIVFDCFLCLSNLHVIMLLHYFSDNDVGFCICHVFFSFFSNLCNRLLTLGIVIYRFTLVLGSSFMFSPNQKRILENIIILAILLTSLNLTGWAIYYREDYKYFLGEVQSEDDLSSVNIYSSLVCSGRSHEFFFNFSDFYKIKELQSPIWSLSIRNPFYLVTIISFFSSMVVTPVCYAAIHR